jgi:hypothetical protein
MVNLKIRLNIDGIENNLEQYTSYFNYAIRHYLDGHFKPEQPSNLKVTQSNDKTIKTKVTKYDQIKLEQIIVNFIENSRVYETDITTNITYIPQDKETVFGVKEHIIKHLNNQFENVKYNLKFYSNDNILGLYIPIKT